MQNSLKILSDAYASLQYVAASCDTCQPYMTSSIKIDLKSGRNKRRNQWLLMAAVNCVVLNAWQFHVLCRSKTLREHIGESIPGAICNQWEKRNISMWKISSSIIFQGHWKLCISVSPKWGKSFFPT